MASSNGCMHMQTHGKDSLVVAKIRGAIGHALYAHACAHARMHACIHAHEAHARTPTCTKRTHEWTHGARTYALMHACIPAGTDRRSTRKRCTSFRNHWAASISGWVYMHARTHPCMRACTHACTHARTHARVHARTHARRTCTCTRTGVHSSQLIGSGWI